VPTSWDPRYCPACGERDDAQREAVCTACGKPWDPERCPACGGSNFITYDLAELYYKDDAGLACRRCEHIWQSLLFGDAEKCPECSSRDVGPARKTIPDLASTPEIAILCAAEQRIPRAENGAILASQMVDWLALHGVTDPREVREWEEWFVTIGSMRSQIEAEVMDLQMSAGKPAEEEEGDA
jgi:RNA polymerase subunit RPABC4/transcription elongation factor Spt4